MVTATNVGYGELVLLEKKDSGIGIITFNRPDKRNAMSSAAQAEFRAALDDCREDCKVLILTGNGVAFCSGVDLKEGQTRAAPQFAYGSNSWFETNEVLKQHPAVCIAAVNGFALGGGLTVVNNCDLAIASERAEFGMPEMSFNTFPGWPAGDYSPRPDQARRVHDPHRAAHRRGDRRAWGSSTRSCRMISCLKKRRNWPATSRNSRPRPWIGPRRAIATWT